MSKVFNSPTELRKLSVEECNGGDFLLHIAGKGPSKAFLASHSDAPALALAILESAGYEEDANLQFGEAAQYEFSRAMYRLRRGIEASMKATAEAKEREELEAEAFKLYRAYMAVHEPLNAIGTWYMLTDRTRETWLAVARKARELKGAGE